MAFNLLHVHAHCMLRVMPSAVVCGQGKIKVEVLNSQSNWLTELCMCE